MYRFISNEIMEINVMLNEKGDAVSYYYSVKKMLSMHFCMLADLCWIHSMWKEAWLMLKSGVPWPNGLVHWICVLMSLSKTLYHNCFSPPRSNWVPVRAELVVVFD